MVHRNQSLLSKWLKVWRKSYRSNSAKEFDPDWLWAHFKMYWLFLGKILGVDHDLLLVSRKQWLYTERAVKFPETLHHRTRRGGKTLLLSHLCVFFNLLQFGLGSLRGKVIYRAPHQNQLKGLKQWLTRNPFFVKSRKGEYEIDLYGSNIPIDAACLSPATSVGLECAVLIEDEYQGIKKESEMFVWMSETRAFLAKGEIYTKRHIHASSGRVNTPFHDDYLMLMNENPDAVCILPYTECSWITEEHVEKERKRNFMHPYFVEEQYECKWVLVSGHFFEQRKLHIIGLNGQADIPQQMRLQPNCAGVDFNGETVGHVLSLCYWDNAHLLVVFDEIIFQHIKDLANWIRSHPNITTEVEGTAPKNGRVSSGGYNAGFADHLNEFNVNVSYQDWGEARVKQYRLALLQQCEVYVYPKCKWFIKNYKEATYDEKGDVDGRPKLLKTADQHGLDGTLHALNSGGDLDIIDPQSGDYYSEREWENFADSIAFH